MSVLRFFVGYDPVEAAAYHVLTHSILRRATVPVAFTPIARSTLGALYTRTRGPLESTDFSLTRFLTPYLAGFEGVAVYLDCDMLCQVDVAELWREVDRTTGRGPWAVAICPHDYTPSGTVKFQQQPQTTYPRKNWSSFMVFNAERCRALYPGYVNEAPALELHRFCWVPDDLIAPWPLEWNWLVGEYPANPQAKFLHYTLGGPWFPETAQCDEADRWQLERGSIHGL